MDILIPDRESLEISHDAVLQFTGGKQGVLDEKLLISALDRPRTYVGYADSYDLNTVCAVLIDSIARYHGFNDGNKRTALMICYFTYRMNDVHFKVSVKLNDDLDDLVMWVVTKKPQIDEIVARLVAIRKVHEGKNSSWGVIFTAFTKSILARDHSK